jgi:hypothetical protein
VNFSLSRRAVAGLKLRQIDALGPGSYGARVDWIFCDETASVLGSHDTLKGRRVRANLFVESINTKRDQLTGGPEKSTSLRVAEVTR